MGTMLFDCSYAQVGKAIKPGGFPTHAYLCMSDAKVVDAQSGLETAAGAILGALAGINMISGPGMLDFESSFSLEQLVVDAESVGMAKRLIRGVDDSEMPFALDVIREVGHEGNFLKSRHTKEHFRTEDYIPSNVIDRDVYQAWVDKGALDARARAHRRVQELLARYGEPPLSAERVGELDAIAGRYARAAGLDQLPLQTGRAFA
jgi:trimethylamine--corrinoid protein Co-methyltransferase